MTPADRLLELAEKWEDATDAEINAILRRHAHPSLSPTERNTAFLDLVDAIQARDDRNDDWSRYSDTYLDPDTVWTIKLDAVDECLRVLLDGHPLAVAS